MENKLNNNFLNDFEEQSSENDFIKHKHLKVELSIARKTITNDDSVCIGQDEQETNSINKQINNDTFDYEYDKKSLSLARKFAFYSSFLFAISRCFVRLFNYYYSSDYGDYYGIGRLFIMVICNMLMVKYKINYEEKSKDYKIIHPVKLESPFIVFQIKEYDNKESSTLSFSEKYYNQFLLARSAFLALNIQLFYLAFSNLKLGVASIIVLTQPIFLNTLASLILKEKLNPKYFIAFVIALIGIFIMFMDKEDSKKNTELAQEQNEILGYFCGFLAAFTVACMNIISNITGKQLDAFNLNFITGFWSFIIFLSFSLVTSRVDSLFMFFDFPLFLIVVGTGIVSFVSFTCLQMALSLNQVSKISYMFFLQIIFTTIFGVILFDEILNLSEIIGGGMIFITMIIVSIYVN